MMRILRMGSLFAAALLIGPMLIAGPAKSEPATVQSEDQRLDDVDQLTELKVVANLDDVHEHLLVLNDALLADAPGKFWIGLRCSNVDQALRVQLGLAEGKGLLVDEVMPDSPAKKAGIEQYDVLLKFGDRELSAVSDLVDGVQKTEKNEVSVNLIRAGKSLTVKVTPAERDPAAVPPRVSVIAEPNVNYQQLHSLLEKLQKSGPQGDVHWQVLRPNVIVSKKQIAALPKGMTISITKSGDDEAKIVVQRGGDKWEATEKTLDKLPEDVRKSVEQFLGVRAHGAARTYIHSWLFGDPASALTLPPVAGGLVAPPAALAPDRTQKQLDEIRKQLDELRKAVESLQPKKE